MQLSVGVTRFVVLNYADLYRVCLLCGIHTGIYSLALGNTEFGLFVAMKVKFPTAFSIGM